MINNLFKSSKNMIKLLYLLIKQKPFINLCYSNKTKNI